MDSFFFNSFTLYPKHSRVGRGNLMLRHSVWGRLCRRGTKCGCKIDWLWARSPLELWNIYLHLYFRFFALVEVKALSSATQHAMPPELGGKRGMECLYLHNCVWIVMIKGHTSLFFIEINNVIFSIVNKKFKFDILLWIRKNMTWNSYIFFSV